MISIRKKDIWFILLVLGLSIRVNLIGSISLTELFVLLQTPLLLKWVLSQPLVKLRKIFHMFCALVLIQIIAEICVGNSMINSFKGIMVTVITIPLMLYFTKTFLYDYRYIGLLPIALLLRVLLFGDQFDFAEKAGAGTSVYFKFFSAPVILYVTLFFTTLDTKFKKHYWLLTFVAALVIIIGGARSIGFSLLFSSILVYVVRLKGKIGFRKYAPTLLAILVLLQLGYAYIYVPKVSTGEWGSEQNRMQLAKINNSKNIFGLILAARTDFFVSYIAFMDKPLWGHGSWAVDHTLKYNRLLTKFLNKDAKYVSNKSGDKPLVPIHSVIIGMGARNGIFAFALFLFIFIYMMRLAVKALDKDTPYLDFYMFYIFNIFQAIMFGPPATLKNMGALAFAVFIACYYHMYLQHWNKGLANKGTRNTVITD